MNDYRAQQLQELLEVSRRRDAKLTVQQLESLLDWEKTPEEDARRLTAALDRETNQSAASPTPIRQLHAASRELHVLPERRNVLARLRGLHRTTA